MTEAPIEWHPEADFLRVVCRLGAILPDGSDADTKPAIAAFLARTFLSPVPKRAV